MTAFKPPEGFERFTTESPFIQMIGPFFVNDAEGRSRVGTHVRTHHLNKVGMVHGGFLLAMADLTLTRGSFDPGSAPPRATLSLTAEISRPVRPGVWLEAELDIIRIGRTVSFVRCDMTSDGKRVASASGVFRNVPPPKHTNT
ncbi:hypothetical protein HKCCE2091_03675 [Rhodobacterales bacterium HKCCE2091]|nr:hypothetical protein [Rhodobacterales bacterium HKCCE2091]